jgi:hypothetical protein
MQAKLDEEAGQLVQLRQNIGQEWTGRALAGETRHQAQDVQHCIADDARARLPPASNGVGQNLAAAAILLRAMPEPSTTEGAAYPGRTQESPGGCRGPTGRELCLPKASVPPGASCRDFLIHTGSLGPHRAHAGHNACSPGSPRQRAPPPRPSSPPRREGAPRLPP